MQCEHPITRTYRDAITGAIRQCVCPCGKCAACRHNQQQQWVIRLTEEMKSKKEMVYETLTIAPGSMYYVDMKEPEYLHGEPYIYGTTQRYMKWRVNTWKKYSSFKKYYPHISYDSYKILRKNNFNILVFPKKEIQDWIKRGRIAYKRHYGVNPNFTYFLVEEYGSVTSRPHFHALFFGVSLADYMRFWGKEWHFDYGFSKPNYFQYTPFNQKEISSVVRYITKYISKGVYEISLVKDGVYDLPYRLISKGIGEGYSEQSKFDNFRNPELTKWAKYGRPSEETFKKRYSELIARKEYKKALAYKTNYYLCGKELERLNDIQSELDILSLCEPDENRFEAERRLIQQYIDISCLTEQNLRDMTVYYDSNAYPHALPRYYKNKLLKYQNYANIYSSAVQNVLLARADMLNNTRMAEFANSLGYSISPEKINREKGTIEGLSPQHAFVLFYRFDTWTRSQAEVERKRREPLDKNFYSRIQYSTDRQYLL